MLRVSSEFLALPADTVAVDHGWVDLTNRCEDLTPDDPTLDGFAEALTANADLKALLDGVFGNSPFLTSCIMAEPKWLQRVIQEGPDRLLKSILDDTRGLSSTLPDETTLMRSLRVNKRRLALTAGLADIAGQWHLYEVTEALSDFADASISAAADFVVRRAADRGAFQLKDELEAARDSGYTVIGMGKLGGRELNYSSDVDLICLFDPELIDTSDPNGLQQHAIRMTRSLAKILDERTTDGYVFRVDLRLRPDPGSTPLAISTIAAETYYESLGQNWERAAMIKARPVGGDLETGERFLNHLRPFVWRKSLDFAAIQDIHSIKRQMHAHKGGGEIAINAHDIKTGRGGIREIEFFAQTQQLIWGGRVPELRCRRTIETINRLVELDHVDPKTAKDLDAAYAFLRRVEHRLQMRSDEQTQRLPSEDTAISNLARFCGYETDASFRDALTRHLTVVSEHYGDLFEDAPSLMADGGPGGRLSFTGVESDPGTLDTLSNMGFENPANVDNAIRAWHHGRIRATRSVRARELLTELTPALLSALSRQPDPDATFLRFDTFISALPAGVQLFSLFHSKPNVLNLIAEIMGEAPRLATHLGKHPSLLDSVLSADFYDSLPTLDELVQDCQRSKTDSVFFEDILDATRRWNHDRRFQVGVQLLRGAINAEAAASAFSDIAEAVLRVLVPEVIRGFEERHGIVPGGSFCILALGKLGSRELTPSSDLDLIFVYDATDLTSYSDGEKPLSASQYYARMGQRVISAITSMTAEGTLYEIDMRLRPSGNKGPVASSRQAIERYYDEDAWTWEYLALVRSRIVFDTSDLGQSVVATIKSALRRERDIATLAADVLNMRRRIAEQHTTKCIWSLKHVPGGQVDIDFLAQFLVLANANSVPEIISRDAVKIFSVAGHEGLIDPDAAEHLIAAKRLYRQIQTFLSLAIEGELTDAKVETFSEPLKDDLARISDAPDYESLVTRLVETQSSVHRLFEDHLKGKSA